MSIAIKEARAATQGAGPAGMQQGGLFDVFKKVVSFIPGVGPIAATALDLIPGGGPPQGIPGIPPGIQLPKTRTGRAGRRGRSVAERQALRQEQRAARQAGGGVARDTTPAVTCPSGFHPNKADYYAKSPTGVVSFIPKGFRCVKNRRRNPLNPRALSRSMGRITAAKNASSALSRITIRKKC